MAKNINTTAAGETHQTALHLPLHLAYPVLGKMPTKYGGDEASIFHAAMNT